MRRSLAIFAVILLAGATRTARAGGFEEIEKRVVEHKLANGMRFLILERHEAPVVAFATVADCGSANDPAGETGLAHVFEHMAFKGTTEIGTKDAAVEAALLDNLDAKFEDLLAERARATAKSSGGTPPPSPPSERLAVLEKAFKAAEEEAGKLVVSNEYSIILERNGAQGLNAGTGADFTIYTVELPANKVELWFYLESARFRDPVLREFYKEVQVVLEERRMRTESNPVGKLVEEFLRVAFKAHPYGVPGIGHSSDLLALTRRKAEAFFKKHYGPSNLTVAIVGDVDPKQAIALAEKYFGPIPRREHPEPLPTVEPPQAGLKSVEVESQAQPLYGIAYHKPAASHPDALAYDTLAAVLGQGSTSRIHKSLVKGKKVALDAGAASGLPGQKYANLFLIYALPSAGHTVEECAAALDEEIAKLVKEPVTDAELERVKTQARAGFLRGLDSNDGLAGQLTLATVIYGDWREMFRQLEKIEAVTAADVQRVAKECFVRRNRTEGKIVKPEAEAEQ